MRFTCGRKGKIATPLPLRDDESGMALIYTTILLPVIVGFALLAVDVGRFTTLNSSLQHGPTHWRLLVLLNSMGAPTPSSALRRPWSSS